MFVQDVKKVNPYRTLGPIATTQITKTIFQKFLLKFVETFKSISEFFKDLTSWKKKPAVDHIKLIRKKNSNVRKNNAPQTKISLPTRVDNTAMKIVAPAAAPGVVIGEKKIDEKQTSPWGDFLKEHATALAIIAGATVVAGGVAYLTYCYSTQPSLAPKDIDNICRNWAPVPDFYKAAEKVNTPQILNALDGIYQNPIPNLADTFPTIVEPIYKTLSHVTSVPLNVASQSPIQNLSATISEIVNPVYETLTHLKSIPLNVSSQCPIANLSAAVPEIANPVYETLTHLKSIPFDASTQSPIPSLFAAIPKVVKPVFETFTDVKSISLDPASHSPIADLSNAFPKILNPVYQTINSVKSTLLNVSPYSTNLTIEATPSIKHFDLNPVYQTINSVKSTLSNVSLHCTNLTIEATPTLKPFDLNPVYQTIDSIKSTLSNVSLPCSYSNLTIEPTQPLQSFKDIFGAATQSISNSVYTIPQSLQELKSIESITPSNLTVFTTRVFSKLEFPSIPSSNLPSLTNLTNILSNFLPSYDSITTYMNLQNVLLFGLVTKEALQFWKKRDVKETVVHIAPNAAQMNNIFPLKENLRSPEKINNDQQITEWTSKYNQWMIEQEQVEGQQPQSKRKFTDDELKKDLNKFQKIFFNEFIPDGRKLLQKINKEFQSLNDDLLDARDYTRDSVYEANQSIIATQKTVENLTDVSHTQFETMNIQIAHQNALLQGLVDVLSTVGLLQFIKTTDFTVLNQHIDMLCSRVTKGDPKCYESAKQLLNKYLDDENLPCPPEIINKLASVIEIYKFKTDIKAHNFKFENLNDPILFDERFENFESTKEFIEKNYATVMLFGNSDQGLADAFYTLSSNVLSFYNDHIYNVEVKDEKEESLLDTLDHIIFNNAKSKVEEKLDNWEMFSSEILDEDVDKSHVGSTLNTPKKDTPKSTPKAGSRIVISSKSNATPKSNAKGTPKTKFVSTPIGTPQTPKAKLTLTPKRNLESTPEYKSFIDAAKKKLNNELKGKLQQVSSGQKPTISILKKPTITTCTPQSKLTININSTLNRIINLSKDLVNMGEDEFKVHEKNVLIDEMSKYFNTNVETLEFKEIFDEYLVQLEASLNQLAGITKIIKFVDSEYETALTNNIASQKKQIDAYNNDGSIEKADKSFENSKNLVNELIERRKSLKYLHFQETEKFNSIKISILMIGKKIGSLVPVVLDDNNFIDLKPIPIECSEKIKKSFKNFNGTTQKIVTPKADVAKTNIIRNTLTELFNLTEKIVYGEIHEGEILEKQQSLIEEILDYFHDGYRKSKNLRNEFLLNQELIVETFKNIIKIGERSVECNMELLVAEEEYEKAKVSGNESEESIEEKRVAWEKLNIQSSKIRKEHLEETGLLKDYRKLYAKFAEEIAKIPHPDDEMGRTPSPVPVPKNALQDNKFEFECIPSPAQIPKVNNTNASIFISPPNSPYLNNLPYKK